MHPTVVIVGLGEVGKLLVEIPKRRYQIFSVDINQPASISQCDVRSSDHVYRSILPFELTAYSIR
jgi:prephenate dehydrogenase